MTRSMITTRGLRKRYRSTPVLDGVDLDVPAGEIVALLGPNGAGKTTTVSILTTLITPDAGEASVAGHDVVRDPAAVRAALSLTGQFAAVDGFQTGRENLAMMARLSHLRGRTARLRVEDLLEQFELEDAADRRVTTYSGGMRRRLDLAISLLAAPPVVFLDEPTTGLDPRSRAQLWRVVRELSDTGTTILLTTQYLEEADRLADTVAVLNAGRVVASGTAAALKSGVGGERVELVLESEDDFARATTVRFGEDARFDPERFSVSVPVPRGGDPVRSTREMLALSDERGLAISSIELHKPTLDDVFLSLTGSASTASATASASATATEEVAA